MNAPLKIAVVEPSLIIRSGLLSVLGRVNGLNIQIVEIGQVDQLAKSLGWQQPDVLIVNPSLLGLFSLERIKGESGCRALRCVALQYSLADNAALKGYDEVITVYDTAEQIREKLLRLSGEEQRAEPRQETLSAREREIVVGVVKGLTNKQIAAQLCLSAHTVITHRRNIAAKLQIHSPAGLTIYAIVNKLVEINDIKDTIAEE